VTWFWWLKENEKRQKNWLMSSWLVYLSFVPELVNASATKLATLSVTENFGFSFCHLVS